MCNRTKSCSIVAYDTIRRLFQKLSIPECVLAKTSLFSALRILVSRVFESYNSETPSARGASVCTAARDTMEPLHFVSCTTHSTSTASIAAVPISLADFLEAKGMLIIILRR